MDDLIAGVISSALGVWNYVSGAWSQWTMALLIAVVLVAISTLGVALAPALRRGNKTRR